MEPPLQTAVEPPTTVSPLAESGPAKSCFHCGDPLPPEPVIRGFIAGEWRVFCCAGCEAVAHAIVGQGLDDYYRVRQSLPERPGAATAENAIDLVVYDDPAVQSAFVAELGDGTREASLLLEGIRCSACVWLNEATLRRVPGVIAADINYATHRARVRWDPAKVALSRILGAVAAIGYRASPYDPRRLETVRGAERREALWRLFVAGFGMMQVMMYAVPVYLAAEGTMPADIEGLMRWASLVLTLPVVLYSAQPFFRGALRDLRLRRLGMDVPVALGVAVAFGASMWATLAGSGEVYFDSVTMFVFLLLAGRYLELRARQRAANAIQYLAKLQPELAERLPDFPASMETVAVPASTLKPGDLILVKPGAVIPADGTVAEGRGEVEEAVVTGESRAIPKSVGAAVVGGAVNVGAPLVVRVERVGPDSMLAAIVRMVERAVGEKQRIALLADRYAHWFVLAILLTAGAAASAWAMIEPARALWIAVAVLVVTCPCALSLATPVALTAATGELARSGFVVTHGHTIEALAAATDVVFDKTGTLTRGEMRVIAVEPLAGASIDECLVLAAALEQGSEHAIAHAVLDAARERGLAWPVATAIDTRPGEGVYGVVNGRRYMLGRTGFALGPRPETRGQALSCSPTGEKSPPGAVVPSSLQETRGEAPSCFPVPGKSPLSRGLLSSVAPPQSSDASPRWCDERDEAATAQTVVWLSREGVAMARLALGDTLRMEAAEVIERIRATGKRIHLLSGDALGPVAHVASALGVATWRAAASPSEKCDYVASLQAAGSRVCMVGDGVNDAPVLARAAVSVAMASGAHLAQTHADAVLLSGRLDQLADALDLARQTIKVIRQNLFWAFAYNVVAVPLAVAGLVTPWLAGLGMSLSSLAVVLNALRLRRPRRQRRQHAHVGVNAEAPP